jgi:hypothetical protein
MDLLDVCNKYVIFVFRPSSAKCDACRTRPYSGVDNDQSLGRRKDTFSESANVNLTVDGKPGYVSCSSCSYMLYTDKNQFLQAVILNAS